MLRRFPLNRDGTFIENFATENHLWLTLLALHSANKYFRGMVRDDGSQEITHATATCCGLIDREILLFVPDIPINLVDEILTVALLHDLIENTNV
ncbi:MAG TPA: hypothetical protein ENH35_03425, partial [Candidatus Moranbacteria bacterium]|nr:hypothetical protein [Candidatus Moranbacteria bacterium]